MQTMFFQVFIHMFACHAIWPMDVMIFYSCIARVQPFDYREKYYHEP